MKDILEIFNDIKWIMVVIAAISTAGTVYLCKKCFESARSEREFIYVADTENTLLLALAKDAPNRKLEGKAHIRRLHELLYVLSPNMDLIESRMKKALSLGDNSLRQHYLLLKERNFFNSMIAEGASSEIQCDSIIVQEGETGKLQASFYGKTSLINSEKIVFRQLHTDCLLSTCERSIENPNGFYVEKWVVKGNKVIGEINIEASIK